MYMYVCRQTDIRTYILIYLPLCQTWYKKSDKTPLLRDVHVTSGKKKHRDIIRYHTCTIVKKKKNRSEKNSL